MYRKELVKAILKSRGDLMVEALNHQDVFYIKASKADLIDKMTQAFDEDMETGFTLDTETEDGVVFFGRDLTIEPWTVGKARAEIDAFYDERLQERMALAAERAEQEQQQEAVEG